MTNIAELIHEEAKTLPEHLGAEVLDFIGYLRSRHAVATALAYQPPQIVELEEFFLNYPRIPKDFRFNRDEAHER